MGGTSGKDDVNHFVSSGDHQKNAGSNPLAKKPKETQFLYLKLISKSIFSFRIS